jgi:hypothetical protein
MGCLDKRVSIQERCWFSDDDDDNAIRSRDEIKCVVARTSGGIDRLALPLDAAMAADGGVWIVAGGSGGLNDVALSELAPDRWAEDCQLLPGFPWSALGSETARPSAVVRVDGAWVVQTEIGRAHV